MAVDQGPVLQKVVSHIYTPINKHYVSVINNRSKQVFSPFRSLLYTTFRKKLLSLTVTQDLVRIVTVNN